MEEKKINEAQVAEQTTSQENVNEQVNEMTELEILKAENKKLKKAFDDEKKACMRYYRQMTIQKGALLKLVEGGKVTQEDIMKAVVDGQGFADFEALVFFMSDH